MKNTKRQQQAAETRQRIVSAATKLFSQFGYDSVSIEDIIKEANVSRGSFYVYFLSKEDLSVYLMFENLGSIQSDIKTAWDVLDKNLPSSELIIAIACNICSIVMNMGVSTIRTIYKIFIERSATTGTQAKELFEMPTLFTSLYELGVKRKEFVQTNAEEVADKIKTIMVGLTIEWCLYHPHYDYIGKTRSLLTDYLNSLKLNK